MPSLRDALDEAGARPFGLRALLDPLYVASKLASVRSLEEARWRAEDLALNLRAEWRLARQRAASLLSPPPPRPESERERLLRIADGRGIDIGCGARPALPGRAETLDYDPRWRHAVDHFSPCDRVPAPDASYDFALASHVLEHLPNPAAALLEWRRVLKPGGRLLLFMPDARLYVPDRRRLEAGWSEATLDWAQAAQRDGLSNGAGDPRHEREMTLSWARGSRHQRAWRSGTARRLLESLGFGVEGELESPPALVRAFEGSLWPAYRRRRFIERSDCGELERRLLALQQAAGAPLLDYSFILVAAK
jgi:SAM-dependent methyltransferase